jgi:hypothetical protein
MVSPRLATTVNLVPSSNSSKSFDVLRNEIEMALAIFLEEQGKQLDAI